MQHRRSRRHRVPPIRLCCGSGPETVGCWRCARGVRAERRRARKRRSARRFETVFRAGNVGSDAVHRRRGRNVDQGADLTDDGDRMKVWTRVEGIVVRAYSRSSVCVIPHREKSEHHARRNQRDQPDLLAHDAHGRSSSIDGKEYAPASRGGQTYARRSDRSGARGHGAGHSTASRASRPGPASPPPQALCPRVR